MKILWENLRLFCPCSSVCGQHDGTADNDCCYLGRYTAFISHIGIFWWVSMFHIRNIIILYITKRGHRQPHQQQQQKNPWSAVWKSLSRYNVNGIFQAIFPRMQRAKIKLWLLLAAAVTVCVVAVHGPLFEPTPLLRQSFERKRPIHYNIHWYRTCIIAIFFLSLSL